MARKRLKPIVLPSVSSSEEEEELTPPQTTSLPSNPSLEDSDSDSDSEEAESEELVEPTTKSAAKRPRSVEDSADLPETSSKKLFQRIWSETDEVILLKNVLHYTAKKGVVPTSDLDFFFIIIKELVHFDVTKAQMRTKLKKMKEKYEATNVREKSGKKRIVLKEHDRKCYELSCKIWGGDTQPKSPPNLSLSLPAENNTQFLYSDSIMYQSSLELFVMKQASNLRNGKDKSMFEARMERYRKAQLKLYIERSVLCRELAEFILEAYQSDV